MSIISVEGKSLGAELAVWGVPHNYALAFAEKSTSKNGRIALHPFFFNDTEHMTNPRHWLAINAAFWCCVYREAKIFTLWYAPGKCRCKSPSVCYWMPVWRPQHD